MQEIEREQFVEHLQSDLLSNIAGLRHAALFGSKARYFISDDGSDVLIHFPRSISRSDIEDYPNIVTVTICKTGSCFDELLKMLPKGKHVLKINGTLTDQRLIERNRFISLTANETQGDVSFGLCQVVESMKPHPESLKLHRFAHWSEEDILLSASKGARFFCLIENDLVVTACVVHNAFGKIWEIGALGTDPDLRGRGFGKVLVRSVTEKLLSEGTIPRYHVNSSNGASLAVAEACGYKPFMVFLHYEFEI